jgi:hypothetical protein
MYVNEYINKHINMHIIGDEGFVIEETTDRKGQNDDR